MSTDDDTNAERDRRRQLFAKMRYWPPELRAVAFYQYCTEIGLTIDYQWKQYDKGWFHVMIERTIVVTSDGTSVGTGEVKRISRREWRRLKQDQELPIATII